jgi:hypothetical protein
MVLTACFCTSCFAPYVHDTFCTYTPSWLLPSVIFAFCSSVLVPHFTCQLVVFASLKCFFFSFLLPSILLAFLLVTFPPYLNYFLFCISMEFFLSPEGRTQTEGEIWGSHGGEDVGVGLLNCDAIWACRFSRDILPPSSPPNLEAVRSSETLLPAYESTWCCIAEGRPWRNGVLSDKLLSRTSGLQAEDATSTWKRLRKGPGC